MVGDGSLVEGKVRHSVLGSRVVVGKGAKVQDSILMNGVVVEEGAVLNKVIVGENSVIRKGAKVGEGIFAVSHLDPKVYNSDLTVIGADSEVPEGVSVGRNAAISGITAAEDYPEGSLPSGGYILKRGTKR